jgi:hypothetical protein
MVVMLTIQDQKPAHDVQLDPHVASTFSQGRLASVVRVKSGHKSMSLWRVPRTRAQIRFSLLAEAFHSLRSSFSHIRPARYGGIR